MYSGYLNKRNSPLSPPSMQKVYCVLWGTLLFDYDNEDDAKSSLSPKLVIEILGVSEWDGKGRANNYPGGLLLVSHTGGQYYVSCVSIQERDEWMLHFRRALECVFANNEITPFKPSKIIQNRSPEVHNTKCPRTQNVVTSYSPLCKSCARRFYSSEYVQEPCIFLQFGCEDSEKVCLDCKLAQMVILWLKTMNYMHSMDLHELTSIVLKDVNKFKASFKLRRRLSQRLDMAAELFESSQLNAHEFEELRSVDHAYRREVIHEECLRLKHAMEAFGEDMQTIINVLLDPSMTAKGGRNAYYTVILRILEIADHAPDLVDFYFPQLYQIHLQQCNIRTPESYVKIDALQQVLLVLSQKFPSFGLKLAWNLLATIGDYYKSIATHGNTTTAHTAMISVSNSANSSSGSNSSSSSGNSNSSVHGHGHQQSSLNIIGGAISQVQFAACLALLLQVEMIITSIDSHNSSSSGGVISSISDVPICKVLARCLHPALHQQQELGYEISILFLVRRRLQEQYDEEEKERRARNEKLYGKFNPDAQELLQMQLKQQQVLPVFPGANQTASGLELLYHLGVGQASGSSHSNSSGSNGGSGSGSSGGSTSAALVAHSSPPLPPAPSSPPPIPSTAAPPTTAATDEQPVEEETGGDNNLNISLTSVASAFPPPTPAAHTAAPLALQVQQQPQVPFHYWDGFAHQLDFIEHLNELVDSLRFIDRAARTETFKKALKKWNGRSKGGSSNSSSHSKDNNSATTTPTHAVTTGTTSSTTAVVATRKKSATMTHIPLTPTNINNNNHHRTVSTSSRASSVDDSGVSTTVATLPPSSMSRNISSDRLSVASDTDNHTTASTSTNGSTSHHSSSQHGGGRHQAAHNSTVSSSSSQGQQHPQQHHAYHRIGNPYLGWDPTMLAGEPPYRITKIFIEECRVFRTKARAPSLVICEVMRDDLWMKQLHQQHQQKEQLQQDSSSSNIPASSSAAAAASVIEEDTTTTSTVVATTAVDSSGLEDETATINTMMMIKMVAHSKVGGGGGGNNSGGERGSSFSGAVTNTAATATATASATATVSPPPPPPHSSPTSPASPGGSMVAGAGNIVNQSIQDVDSLLSSTLLSPTIVELQLKQQQQANQQNKSNEENGDASSSPTIAAAAAAAANSNTKKGALKVVSFDPEGSTNSPTPATGGGSASPLAPGQANHEGNSGGSNDNTVILRRKMNSILPSNRLSASTEGILRSAAAVGVSAGSGSSSGGGGGMKKSTSAPALNNNNNNSNSSNNSSGGNSPPAHSDATAAVTNANKHVSLGGRNKAQSMYNASTSSSSASTANQPPPAAASAAAGSPVIGTAAIVSKNQSNFSEHVQHIVHSAQKLLSGGVIDQKEYQLLLMSDQQYREEIIREEAVQAKSRVETILGESWLNKKERLLGEKAHTTTYQVAAACSVEYWPAYDLKAFIVKTNDDLRQEICCLQLMQICKEIFDHFDLSHMLFLKPYRIICTGHMTGVVEVLKDAISLDALKRTAGFTTLLAYFKKVYDTSAERLAQAKYNFMSSLAAYSLYCYLFQIKDRHNGNLLIDAEGHILHIDFGFILSIAPGGSFSLETAPFKLTEEMVELLGGLDSPLFGEFVTAFTKGFIALQANCKPVAQILEKLKARFRTELYVQDAVKHCLVLITNSYGHYGTKQYDTFQYYSNGIIP